MNKRKGKKQDVDGRAEERQEVAAETERAVGEEILLEAIRLLPEDVLGQTGDVEEIVKQGEKKKQRIRLLKWAAVAAVILLVLVIAWKSGIYPFGEVNREIQDENRNIEDVLEMGR